MYGKLINDNSLAEEVHRRTVALPQRVQSRKAVQKIFKALKAASDFRRRQLPFVETFVDLELVRDIGLHQAQGQPATFNVLCTARNGSIATVQRRLNRLKRLGVVLQTPAAHDKRVAQLVLSPDILKRHQKLARLMRSIWASS